MADHTPLPWKATPAEQYGDGFTIGNDDSNAAFVAGYQDHPHIIANVALIVRACNSHGAMLEALKRAKVDLQAAKIVIESYKNASAYGIIQTLEIIDAAVAAAKAPSLTSQDVGGGAA